MPIKTQIIPDKNLMIRTASGTLTIPDVLNTINNVLTDENFIKDMHAIWDFSNATFHQGTTEEISKVIEHLKKSLNSRGSNYKIAIVAPEDLNYGISRIFAAYGSELPLPIGIYRTIDDAYHWLEIQK